MGDNHFVRQHEHLRVPQGWTGQDKALVIQLERILDDIYKRFGRLGMKDLDEEVQGKLSPVSKESDGLCPQLPDETATTKYLRQDGSWETPPGTTYSVVSKTANGLAPQLPNETSTTKYLRQDGTWKVPPDTTYESKAAASGGSDVSLCTTGEKFTWNSKAPTSHAASATTYGAGTASNYGHTKLSDTYASVSTSQKAANSVGASAWALQSAFSECIKLNTYAEVAKSSSKAVASVPNGSLIVFAYSAANRVMALKTSNSTLRTLISDGTYLTLTVSSGTVTADNGLAGASAYLLIISP